MSNKKIDLNDAFDDALDVVGLSLSKEQREENKRKKELEDIFIESNKKIDLKEGLEKFKQSIEKRKQLEQLKELNNYIQEKKESETVKKTVIIKRSHLRAIKGIALLKDMTQTDVLNKLLSKALEELENANKGILEKANKEIENEERKDKELF